MRFVHYTFFIYAQILKYKRKLMRLLGVFQQAESFVETGPYDGSLMRIEGMEILLSYCACLPSCFQGRITLISSKQPKNT